MTICTVCKEEREEDSYCFNCYSHLINELANLNSLGRDIEWKVRKEIDIDFLTSITELAECVTVEAVKLRDKFKAVD